MNDVIVQPLQRLCQRGLAAADDIHRFKRGDKVVAAVESADRRSGKDI
jgi:hypothetical protein